jgi:hypothetical protein
MNPSKYDAPRNCGDESLAWRIGVTAVFAIVAVLLALLFGGCDRGDIRATVVIEGQPAPHDGWNVGPDLWLRAGEPAKVAGAVVDVDGLDPNSVFGGDSAD